MIKLDKVEIPARRFVKMLDYHPTPWKIKIDLDRHRYGYFTILDANNETVIKTSNESTGCYSLENYEDRKKEPIDTWTEALTAMVKKETILNAIVQMINESE